MIKYLTIHVCVCAAIDEGKLLKFCQSKGIPVTEEEVAHIIDRVNSNSDGLLEDFPSMRLDATNSVTPKSHNFLAGLGQRFGRWRSLTIELDEVLQQTGRNKLLSRSGSDYTTGSSGECNDHKVENAFLFSDIDRVETLDVWKSSEIKKYIYCPLVTKDEGSIRQRTFAIFLRDKLNEPLVILCSKQEEVKDWMDALEICIGEQKSMVLGRNRGSVRPKGKIFGINSSRRWWRSTKDVGLSSSINWASSKKWDGIDDI